MESKKVSAGPGFEPHQILLTPTAIDFDQEFKNKLYDKEEEFRSKIILEINEFAGNDWYVHFIDFASPSGKKFIVDITISKHEYQSRIVNVITNAFPDFDFSFYVKNEKSPFAQTPFFMYDRPNS